jgi:multisubunit Na+/H+ antiporter MnhE subunit
MRKRPLVLFAVLLVFWLVISAEMDLQHILVGIFLTLIVVWFWQDLGPRLPGMPSAEELLRLGHCLVLLAGHIIQSNITVAKILLFSGKPVKVSPVFVEMETPIRSNWGRVLLATCITITPGTVTIDIDPETGRFIVHALTEEIAIGLPYWRLIYRIRDLETCKQRRAKHVVGTGRTYDLDSRSTIESDYRADNH